MILIDGLRLRTPTNCQAMPRDGGTVNLPRFPRSPEPGRPDSRQAAYPTPRPGRPHPVFSSPKFGRGPTPPRQNRQKAAKLATRAQRRSEIAATGISEYSMRRRGESSGVSQPRKRMKIASPVAPKPASDPAPETTTKTPHTRCPRVHPAQCEQTLWSERPRGGLLRSLFKTIQSHTCKRLKAQKKGSAEPPLRALQKKTGEQAGGRRTFSDLGRINRRPGYGNGGHRRAHPSIPKSAPAWQGTGPESCDSSPRTSLPATAAEPCRGDRRRGARFGRSSGRWENRRAGRLPAMKVA